MHENGFEVVMVSSDGKEVDEVTIQENSRHIVIPFTRKISPIQDIKCLVQLIQLIKKEKPDIVHTHTPKAGLIGMLASKIAGVNVKLHTVAGLPLMTATSLKRKILVFTEKLTYWAADTVLPNSNSIYNYIQEHNFVSSDKLDMIGNGSSNGIDLERFSRSAIQSKKLEQIKKGIKYDESKKYILSVGRVVKDKGIVELVRAFLKVSRDVQNIVLLIVGSLEYERAEELLPFDVLDEIKGNKNIIHINWSDEVEYYMYLADVLVHASYREGFPNVPLQAGAMECPIVCSNIPGNVDIVTDNYTGLYFEVGNTEELIERITMSLNKREQMQLYTKTLRKEIEDKFDRKKIHDEMRHFYLKLLNS